MTTLLTILYAAALLGLSLYGFFGLLTFAIFLRHPRHDPPLPRATTWPMVTVQLPIFNERYVVEQLIDAAVALDYPSARLQIQVLDDSTDDTAERAAARVRHHRQAGVDIQRLPRTHRAGFKAGALAQAARGARGELIVLFDADFEPPADFLRRTVPYFEADPRLGVVQARWAHLNRTQSALTAAQAIALDKHFAVDQLVRDRARLLPKFNGSASVLRRACLESVGGWQSDTVCEDLSLEHARCAGGVGLSVPERGDGAGPAAAGHRGIQGSAGALGQGRRPMPAQIWRGHRQRRSRAPRRAPLRTLRDGFLPDPRLHAGFPAAAAAGTGL